MTRQTILSTDRVYRYSLWREWIGGEGYVMFIGLNPSTADETNDDPTVRRCIGFAKRWGFSALCMTNLFAFRATDPNLMMRSPDPIGKYNDSHLLNIYNGASLVVAAWGTGGWYLGRDREVFDTLGAMDCLGLTKDGYPRHPLYVRANIERQDFIVSNRQS